MRLAKNWQAYSLVILNKFHDDSSKIVDFQFIVKIWASLILQSNKVKLPVGFDKPKKADRVN